MRIKQIVLTIGFLTCILMTAYVLTTAQSNNTSVEPVPPLETPPDKHIVYFVTEDSGQISDLVMPQKLAATLGSQTAHSWEEVLNQNAARAIDALIIHNSKLDEVDRSWASSAYRNGTVIAGLNISGQQMADLS